MKPMKKHKFKILTFVAVAAALAGTGCFKSIGYETFYVLWRAARMKNAGKM